MLLVVYHCTACVKCSCDVEILDPCRAFVYAEVDIPASPHTKITALELTQGMAEYSSLSSRQEIRPMTRMIVERSQYNLLERRN